MGTSGTVVPPLSFTGQRTAERSYVGRERAAHVGLLSFAVLVRVLVTHLPELVLIPFLRRSLKRETGSQKNTKHFPLVQDSRMPLGDSSGKSFKAHLLVGLKLDVHAVRLVDVVI